MRQFVLNTKVGFLSASGPVSFSTTASNHPTVKIEIGYGYKIDLVSRVTEAAQNWGNTCSVRMWLAQDEFDRNAAIGAIASMFDGHLVADFETRVITYSEYTSDTSYDTDFKVGGHDLFKILENTVAHSGFLMIDIAFNGVRWDDVDEAIAEANADAEADGLNVAHEGGEYYMSSTSMPLHIGRAESSGTSPYALVTDDQEIATFPSFNAVDKKDGWISINNGDLLTFKIDYLSPKEQPIGEGHPDYGVVEEMF